MAERHFGCTACGKCCHGWLPLTLSDALAHAGRFPLALVWTPVRQASRAYAVTARLGATVRLPGGKPFAVRIVPTSYVPPAFACPELTPDNLCGIHAAKPSRCRTMPFFPYNDESDQAANLIPRPGWACDTSSAAPVVYQNKRIVDRKDFDCERAELLKHVALLRAHAEAVLPSSPSLIASLSKAASAAVTGGHVVTSFTSLLPRLPRDSVMDFASRQLPVLRMFAERAAADASLAHYREHYQAWAREVERIVAYAVRSECAGAVKR